MASPCPWVIDAESGRGVHDSSDEWTDVVAAWLRPIVHLAEVVVGAGRGAKGLQNPAQYWRSHSVVQL